MEPAITLEQLEGFRTQLLQLRARITSAVDARLHGQDEDRRNEAGLPRRADETDDDAAAETQRSADLVQLSRNAAELDRIDAALRRITDGTYGICIDCSELIASPRLQAYPAALRCAACQERHERRHGARA